MPRDDNTVEHDAGVLVESVQVEMRRDFVRVLPKRLATLEALAAELEQSLGDPQVVHRLQAETHRIAGTTGLYGLAGVSEIARRFDALLMERICAGIVSIAALQVRAFLDELQAAIAAEE